MPLPSQIITGWLGLVERVFKKNFFLSTFFTFKPEYLFDGEEVSFDIRREGRPVAVVVKRYHGPNLNDYDEYTTKTLVPPSYNQGTTLDLATLNKRPAGMDPYQASRDVGYRAQMMAYVVRTLAALFDTIRRAVELQASQIMQTGTSTLVDANGDTTYAINFAPKASHFITVGTVWSNVAADIIGDLKGAADVVVADGKVTPNILLMGSTAFLEFLRNTEIKAIFDNRRIVPGTINPGLMNNGAVLQGNIAVGSYNFAIYTYPETYDDIQTGNSTEYLDAGKVVMLSSDTNFGLLFSTVVHPLPPNPQTEFLLPPTLTSTDNGFNVKPNVYPSESGEQIMATLKSNPLCVPFGIDEFACLTT